MRRADPAPLDAVSGQASDLYMALKDFRDDASDQARTRPGPGYSPYFTTSARPWTPRNPALRLGPRQIQALS
jgi:hypothetical protein